MIANNVYGGSSSSSPFTYTVSNSGFFQYPANVIIPKNVTTMSGSDSRTLYNHPEIETISWEDGSTMTTFSGVQSGLAGLTTVTFPDCITTINGSFSNCSSLSTININTSIKRTWSGTNSFNSCVSLTNESAQKVCNSALSLGANMFVNCTGLTAISLPYVPNSVVSDCKNLSSVTLEDTVTRIGNASFQTCTALHQISIPNTVTYIDSYAFNISGLTSINIPASVTTLMYGITYNCASLTSFTLNSIPTNNLSWTYTNNMNHFYGCTALTSVQLPEGWNISILISNGTNYFSNVLTHDSMVAILNNLADMTSGTTKTITLGATNLARLSAEEIAIATSKNWTVS